MPCAAEESNATAATRRIVVDSRLEIDPEARVLQGGSLHVGDAVADQPELLLHRLEPIRAGRFFVHTPTHPPDPDAINFEIDAGLAFGTGQHDTTAGCLAAHDRDREGEEHPGDPAPSIRSIQRVIWVLGLLALLGVHEGSLPFVLATSPEQIAEDEDFWFTVQQAFTVDRSIINLNNGYTCPSPRVVHEALKRYLFDPIGMTSASRD